MLRPLLKWAGGKRQLLPELLKFVPSGFDRYFEPFFGGGALYFALSQRRVISEAVLSDSNKELSSFYNIVKRDPALLLNNISKLEYGNSPEDYYAARARYNSIDSEPQAALKAALLIYLNRHCFNGLYRVNSRGAFNVPFGKYGNPKLPDASHILEVSSALSRATILASDFEDATLKASSGDFVYLDPPYAPTTSTANFTNYESNGFNFSDQERLAKHAAKLDGQGVRFMLSNSGVNEIADLYKGYNIHYVYAARAINSRPDGRGKVPELIVTNF